MFYTSIEQLPDTATEFFATNSLAKCPEIVTEEHIHARLAELRLAYQKYPSQRRRISLMAIPLKMSLDDRQKNNIYNEVMSALL